MKKPQSMPAMVQVKNGFRTAGAWLLGMAWLGLVFAGLAIAFSPSKFPTTVGWFLLAIAAVVLVATADRWVKALPGILGIATLNSIVMIATGHATGSPAVHVSRLQAISATILFAGSTIISVDFQGRKQHILDRVAFLVYAICLAYAAIRPVATSWALGTGTAALLAAWSRNRLKSHPSKD